MVFLLRVPLMRLIYSLCDYTFAWLGESRGDSDLAMDFIAGIAELLQRRGYLANGSDLLWELWDGWSSGVDSRWTAAYTLLKRDFWYRVWIYQEMILPKSLVIACGSRSIPWEKFKLLARLRTSVQGDLADGGLRLSRKHRSLQLQSRHAIVALGNVVQQIYPVFEHRMVFDKTGSLPLQTLLAESIHLRASDPRDKIYGLLALDKFNPILPDYSKDIGQIYTDFARSSSLESLAHLPLSGLYTSSGPANGLRLPTWVPDWNAMSQSTTQPLLRWARVSGGFGLPHESSTVHLAKMKFRELLPCSSSVAALEISGQIGGEIKSIQTYHQWLEPENFHSMISATENVFRPPWRRDNENGEQMARFQALCYTIMQKNVPVEKVMTEKDTEIIAGFCYTTYLRMNVLGSLEHWNKHEPRQSQWLQDFARYLGYPCGEEPLGFSFPSNETAFYKEVEEKSFENRVFFEMLDGAFGMGPLGTESGDIVCKLYGAYFPVILRPFRSHYLLVGACWILGFLGRDGLDESKSTRFEIW